MYWQYAQQVPTVLPCHQTTTRDPRVAEIMVDGDQAHEIRRRETISELMNGESLLPE